MLNTQEIRDELYSDINQIFKLCDEVDRLREQFIERDRELQMANKEILDKAQRNITLKDENDLLLAELVNRPIHTNSEVLEIQAEIKQLKADNSHLLRLLEGSRSKVREVCKDWQRDLDKVNELQGQVRRLEKRPWLGYATTRELLTELSARFEILSGLNYKPVNEII